MNAHWEFPHGEIITLIYTSYLPWRNCCLHSQIHRPILPFLVPSPSVFSKAGWLETSKGPLLFFFSPFLSWSRHYSTKGDRLRPYPKLRVNAGGRYEREGPTCGHSEQVREQPRNSNRNVMRYLFKTILPIQDFPGGPVVKTPRSQCRGPGFNPWSGN